MEEIIVKVDGKEHKVKVEETEDGKIKVYCGKDVYDIETKPETLSELEKEQQKKEKIKHGDNIIVAPLPGTIVEVNCKENQNVAEGDSLIKLVAMKMENEITAPRSGVVQQVNVSEGFMVNKGELLFLIQ